MKNETCPKCKEASKILEEWTEKQGHDRCWYYPDLFNKLAKLLGVSLNKTPNLPPRTEFEKGCKKYQDEEYR